MLLYADRGGHLRVVITMRAASLRSFSGTHMLPPSFVLDIRTNRCTIVMTTQAMQRSPAERLIALMRHHVC